MLRMGIGATSSSSDPHPLFSAAGEPLMDEPGRGVLPLWGQSGASSVGALLP